MRTAICLYGIHHREAYKHWMGWSINVDYKKTYDSFKRFMEYPIKCMSEVDYYISTYKSTKQDELITDFNPKQYLFNEFVNGSKNEDYARLKKERMMESLMMAGKEYDFYFVCRFDLMFRIPLYNLKVDYNKINLNCKVKPFYGDNDVDDNLFFFPKAHLDTFVNAVKAHDSTKFMHDILNYMDESNVNYLVDEKVFSHEMYLYEISR